MICIAFEKNERGIVEGNAAERDRPQIPQTFGGPPFAGSRRANDPTDTESRSVDEMVYGVFVQLFEVVFPRTGSLFDIFHPPFPLIPRGGPERGGEHRSTRNEPQSEPARRDRRPQVSIALLGPVAIATRESEGRRLRSKARQLVVPD